MFILPWTLGVKTFGMLMAIYTVYHTVHQQTGIAALIARNKSTSYQVWRWLSFAIMALVYMASTMDSLALKSLVVVIFPVFIIVYGTTALVTARQSQTLIGKLYIAATSLMVAVSYGLSLANLPFFMILIPRVVHDVTAFSFYVAHNTNRGIDKPQNVMIRIQKRLQLPEYVLTPLLSIASTAFITYYMKEYLFNIITFLALFHYCWEGVMWKKGSPHRNYIFVYYESALARRALPNQYAQSESRFANTGANDLQQHYA